MWATYYFLNILNEILYEHDISAKQLAPVNTSTGAAISIFFLKETELLMWDTKIKGIYY